MRDQHDRVAHRDAEERHEADQRADAEPAAAGAEPVGRSRGEHAADEREGQVREHQQQVAPAAEHEAEQQQDADERDRGVQQQLAPRGRLCFGGPAKAR